MAEVKWIKITTDMFDNRKIKHLRRLPDGNNIVLIWVMLLTMAGRCNSGGMIFLTENIPYTQKMLADELDFEENTVRLALEALEQLGMVVTENGCFTIAGWLEHQNIEGMEKIREQTRKRVQRHREAQRSLMESNVCQYCGAAATGYDHILATARGGADTDENKVPCCPECNRIKNDKPVADFLNANRGRIRDDIVSANKKLHRFVTLCNVTGRYTVTQSNATDIEEDKEEELEKDKIDYKGIVNTFNEICVSFPSVRSISDARKKAMRARLNTYTVDDFKALFEKAEASSFLKGKNSSNWSATFDWLIKDSNMAKVLDGNYDDKKGAAHSGADSGNSGKVYGEWL